MEVRCYDATPEILAMLPEESRAAYAAWKAARAALGAHKATEPAFPAPPIGGWKSEEERRSKVDAYNAARIIFWRRHRELEIVAERAFVAMAKTLPPIPKEVDWREKDRRRLHSVPTRRRYLAAQAPTQFHEAYPFLVSVSETVDGREVVSVGGNMWDEALPEAAHRQAELDAYYARKGAA